jgi:ABC-type sugar transport system ATPase subunit
MGVLRLEAVRKLYGAVSVLHGIDLEIPAGEFVVFVGPSGCGKSTLLRIIAGLEPVTDGEIRIDGALVNAMEPAERGVAMVFQSYALYPHMTARQNMAFGLKIAGLRPAEVEARIGEAVRALQIAPLLDRLPKDMSGGQRQRVAIGRAIVREPQLFLFDEPLSNLDAALRVQTRIEIAKLHKLLDATMIYVTHDQVEAMTLADRIVVLNAGRVEQVGTPLELYRTPRNIFVAAFIGSPKMNFIPVRFTPNGAGTTIKGIDGKDLARLDIQAAGTGNLGIRPEGLLAGEGPIVASLQHEEHLGDHRLIHARMADGTELVAKLPDGPSYADGATLQFTFDPSQMHLFGADGVRISTQPEGLSHHV